MPRSLTRNARRRIGFYCASLGRKLPRFLSAAAFLRSLAHSSRSPLVGEALALPPSLRLRS